MPQDIHIGTSGFTNYKWKGIFYPDDLPRHQWFEFYCRHFDTFEINSTFYKFPTAKILKSWHQKSPDGFTFAVKAPKIITHINKFIGSAEMIKQFYEVCNDGLNDKLGPLLFQLPPSFKFSEENLSSITSSLNPSFTNVIEFRDPSWWKNTVHKELLKHRIAFASVSYPKMPDEIIDNENVNYIRLHGSERLFYSEYGTGFIRELHQKIVAKTAEKSFVFFNNTASTAGITDALTLQNLINENVIKV